MIDAIKLYRLANWLYKKKIPILPKIIKGIIFLIYNSSIPYEAEIGEKTKLGYGGIAVVIHKRAKIGEKCIISQCVTIGGRSNKGVPIIGDSVYIGAGAKVLGGIKVGSNSIIGANAVVISDVEENTVVAGVPAKVIKKISV